MSDPVQKNALILINDYAMRHKVQANFNYNMHITEECQLTYSCFLRIGILLTEVQYAHSKKAAKLKAADAMLKMLSSKSDAVVNLQSPIDAYALWNGVDQFVTLQNGTEFKTVRVGVVD
jgi:hypothetical protein